MSILENFCPTCKYYMPLRPAATSEEQPSGELQRYCRACGYSQDEKPGLVMETAIAEQASESYLTEINEFTKSDPRLPHVKNLKCPNGACASRTGQAESDVIYKRTDAANMKYIYICTVCDTKWKSRS